MVTSRVIPHDVELIELSEMNLRNHNINHELIPGGYEFFVRKGDKTVGNLELMRDFINNQHVGLQYNKAIPGVPTSVIHASFVRLQNEGAIAPLLFSRDALSSGFLMERTVELLHKDKVLGPIIEILEREKKLKALWVVINLDGSHPLHHDKFKQGSNYRNLVSFLGGKKRMWFRCKKTGRMFGIGIPNNAHVTLDKFGGGMLGHVHHCVVGAANSYLIAFETK